jgi:hypothetical protein
MYTKTHAHDISCNDAKDKTHHRSSTEARYRIESSKSYESSTSSKRCACDEGTQCDFESARSSQSLDISFWRTVMVRVSIGFGGTGYTTGSAIVQSQIGLICVRREWVSIYGLDVACS